METGAVLSETSRRKAQVQAVAAEEKRRKHRRAQVETTLERLIWTESEDNGQNLVSELSDLLDEEILAETFGDEPFEVPVARLVEKLGLALTQAAKATGAPPPALPFQSSA